MKKITKKSRDRIKRINEKNRRHRKRRLVRICIADSWETNNKWLESKHDIGLDIELVDAKNNSVRISLPKRMNLSKDYTKTVLTLNAIRRLVTLKLASQMGGARSAYKLKNVNFDTLTQLSTSAGLVLAAEISHWNDKINKKLTPQCDGWSSAIKTQLTELGFFDLFDLPSPEVSHDTTNIKSIRYFKGRKGDGEMAKLLRKEIETITGNPLEKSTFLYSGLSEAMTNVSEHAYPRNYMSHKNWYMTGGFDTKSLELKVVFYDQGIGIPQSLPRSKLWERAKGFLADKGLTNDHASLIKAAVEMGRTKTDKEYRGKGLQDLLEFIRQRKEGYLSIFSLRGLYKYEQNGDEVRVKTETMDYPIQGTLIIWSITLEK